MSEFISNNYSKISPFSMSLILNINKYVEPKLKQFINEMCISYNLFCSFDSDKYILISVILFLKLFQANYLKYRKQFYRKGWVTCVHLPPFAIGGKSSSIISKLSSFGIPSKCSLYTNLLAVCVIFLRVYSIY